MRELLNIVRRCKLDKFEIDMSDRTMQFSEEQDFRKIYSLFTKKTIKKVKTRLIIKVGEFLV
ncbi:MAG: hypothetical protein N3D20_01685 [Candidatus Pacearchaeota archaeon]|nr:hypothetical protein [Candidatus Pacearchaeota archaeon]